MSRPRDQLPGIHHVGIGATGPSDYFRDDEDRLTWLRLLVGVLDRHTWTCVGFCQLTTHWHALLDIPDESLAAGMHRLNLRYSKAFNGRHGRSGYLVRNRYWSRRIETNEQLLVAYRYVMLNPVTAGMVASPELWHWSSFKDAIGLSDSFPFVDPTAVLSQYGPSPGLARVALRAALGPD